MVLDFTMGLFSLPKIHSFIQSFMSCMYLISALSRSYSPSQLICKQRGQEIMHEDTEL